MKNPCPFNGGQSCPLLAESWAGWSVAGLILDWFDLTLFYFWAGLVLY
jgi:hypothetical protein